MIPPSRTGTVYLIYDGGQNSRLATTDEAVGEGEI